MNITKRAAASLVGTAVLAGVSVVQAPAANAAVTRAFMTGPTQSTCEHRTDTFIRGRLATGQYRAGLSDPCVKRGTSWWESKIYLYTW